MSKFSMKVATSVAILGGIVAAATSASAALNLAPQSCSYSFNTNMKLGSRGTSVMDLQKVLNMYPQTMVAESGVGSSGMETTYFGNATRAAVNKFQALHLAELGITAPTGNVFAGTRGLLNEVCSGSVVSTNPGTTTTYPLGCTSASGFSPITGASCSTGVVTTNPGTTGAVSAALASSQPMGNLISGQAGAALATVTFSGNGVVSSVTLNRGGVSDQSTLSNVYLYDGNTRLTDGYSFNNAGTLTMNNVNLAVNGSRTVTVRGDVASAALSGQTISVVLASFVTGTSVNAVNLMGNTFSVVNGTNLLATANLTTLAPSPAANPGMNAGSMNQNLWSNTVSVGLHAVTLRGMTVKMIGSAPSNALANVALYVDGTKVSTASINGNMQYVFDLTATPYAMTTGSHNVEVRGDVVGGANRNFYLSLEKASDLMINDSQVSGGTVSITPTYLTGTLNNLNAGLVSISNGTLTINQDIAFNNTTNLVSGATQVKMAAYKFTAYGEDVKVNSLAFSPSFGGMTPASTTMINVGLYINGGQVGSNQTATAGAGTLVFNNLGSNLIASVGTPVVVEIRGDVMNSANVNYTAGTVAFNLDAGVNNAQGVGSGQLINTSSAGGQSLTVSSSNVQFAQTSGWAGSTIAPNQIDKKIGSFTIQTGSAEGVTLSNISVGITGTMIGANQITNLTVKDGATVVGTPVGSVNATNNFSVSLPVGMSTTKTFDVYANIGSSAAGLTVIPAMTITYRGSTSNVTTTPAPVTGATINAAVAVIASGDVTFVPSSSAVAQFLIGGQSAFPIGTFNFKNTGGVAGAIVKDVTVTVSTSTIGSVTMNGVTAQVVGTVATLYNVGVVVPADASGINVPMTVSLVCVNNAGGCAGVSSSTVFASISNVTYNNGSSVVSTTTSATTVSSALVASKPTVTMTSVSATGLQVGSQQIGTFTISADAAGDIKIESIPVVTSVNGTITIPGSTVELRDASGNVLAGGPSAVASGTQTFSFGATPRTITKGTSETFTVYATTGGTTGAAGTSNVTFSLGAKAGFLWTDVIGGVSSITGSYLNTYPSGTQSKSN